jgi:methylglyoxal/glyoxal reductase
MDIFTLGFGTYQLDKETAEEAITYALETGYRHIDTANLYKTEDAVGKAIKNSGVNRKDIFVTTKISIHHLKKKKILTGLRASFRKLDLDYIDLVLLHRPVHHKENWKLLEEAFNSDEFRGKIRFIGVSNFSVQHLTDIIETCTIMPYANQIEVTPFLQKNNLVNFCEKHKIKVIAHSSLTRGERLDNVVLCKLAKTIDCTPAQLLLCWAINKGYCVIPRTTETSWIKENFDSKDVKLTDHIIEELNKLNDGFTLFKKYVYDDD